MRFGEPKAGLGNARTAALANGGFIGVRAPMRETEEPVVRPYLLVADIEAAAKAAAAAGGEIAHPPMELPGHGTFASTSRGASTMASGRCEHGGAVAGKTLEVFVVVS